MTCLTALLHVSTEISLNSIALHRIELNRIERNKNPGRNLTKMLEDTIICKQLLFLTGDSKGKREANRTVYGSRSQWSKNLSRIVAAYERKTGIRSWIFS